MSRKDVIIGLAASLALHGAFLCPFGRKSAPDKQDQMKVVALALPAEVVDRSELRNPPPPPPPAPPEKRQPPAPAPAPRPPAEFERVAEAPGTDLGAGDWSDSKIAETILPRLRIVWKSPEDLRNVASRLGMKILAVDKDSRILGEVVPEGLAKLAPFTGRLSDYSNRVRTLPADFFGGSLADGAGQEICGLWILVPASLDRQFIQALKDAIREKGIPMARVGAIEAKFIPTRNGRYELIITDVLGLSCSRGEAEDGHRA